MEFGMKTNFDCRKRENKTRSYCKIKKFCNKRENPISSIGKSMFAMVNPTAGVAITAYETGKSLIKLGVCKK